MTGAGASFPAPVYAKWADAYNKATGVRVNYQSVGSGAGMKQINAKTVDFGASDMPLTDEELAKDGSGPVPDGDRRRRSGGQHRRRQAGQAALTGQVLGDIYLGKITKWNDPAVDRAEPGRGLPDAAIPSVRRADGSGTSFNFTNYLSKVNAEWKAKVGEGTAVNWPTGAGGKGNEGVSSYVQRLPNSIGYVEYAYAKQNKMAYMLLQNQAGNFVAPDDANFKAAAANADWKKSVLPGADRPAGQGIMADHRRDLHPDAQGAGQAGERDQVAEVLRLGLRQRRQDGRRPRLRADARRGEGAGAQALGRLIEGRRPARPIASR